jgi:hypothetical protein
MFGPPMDPRHRSPDACAHPSAERIDRCVDSQRFGPTNGDEARTHMGRDRLTCSGTESHGARCLDATARSPCPNWQSPRHRRTKLTVNPVMPDVDPWQPRIRGRGPAQRVALLRCLPHLQTKDRKRESGAAPVFPDFPPRPEHPIPLASQPSRFQRWRPAPRHVGHVHGTPEYQVLVKSNSGLSEAIHDHPRSPPRRLGPLRRSLITICR